MIATLAVLSLAYPATHPHSEATLVSSVKAVAPGHPFLVGIEIKMDPTWHSYWMNPGDSGIPTTIDWKLPSGWKAGDIQWPTPHKLDANGLVNYGYEHSVLLLVRLTPPSTARIGQTVVLNGNVKWLICQAGCLAASERVSKPVQIGSTREDSSWYAKLTQSASELPTSLPGYSFSASRENDVITLSMIAAQPNPDAMKSSFFASQESIEPAAPQPASQTGNVISWNLKVSEFAPAKISRLRGLLVAPKGVTWGHGRDAIVVDTPVSTRG